ncbi:hypothetical protein [Edwardsiella ictaluri]|nr:hypothetical protein [Edwardsiella ictaluri]EKS7770784.1 hypothetical protein [Edwardsiella ictaluri]EKS7773928.1 hypothetical protein [Edwardsiella ictaluri]EKS7777296.1 hypothetical protein [Edwardsiella ictaluri]EKS7787426.1 hypothetical protein [Edwardsiella ictaluri]EKS7810180.1 hypothetical protein [Edwardsiella ictaluri]
MAMLSLDALYLYRWKAKDVVPSGPVMALSMTMTAAGALDEADLAIGRVRPEGVVTRVGEFCVLLYRTGARWPGGSVARWRRGAILRRV